MRNFKSAAAFLVLSALLIAACASAPSVPPPEWALNIDSVYPREKYIAQIGWGATQKEAERSALGAIARFITSEVRSSSELRVNMLEADGAASQKREINEEVFIESQVNLSHVRYVQEPYYNKQRKKYETVAYLDREEAWGFYAPRFTRLAKAFVELYDSAAAEADPLKAAILYGKAAAYSQSEEFSDAENFGQMLYPQKMDETFSDVRKKLQALPDELAQAKQNTVVYVDVSSDNESRVKNAVVKCLNKAGFAAGKDKNVLATCLVKVDEGYKKTDSGVFYFPSAVITLSGRKAGEVFSCAVSAGKQAAINEDVAKRRAYTALAKAITDNFNKELNKSLEVKDE